MAVIINEVEVVSSPQSQSNVQPASQTPDQAPKPAGMDQHLLEMMVQRLQSRLARLLVY